MSTQTHTYDALFTPWKIGNVEIKNRIVMCPMGGLVLYCACAMHKNPACMLFANPIDSLAAAGAVLADVWVDGVTMPVVDSLGEEFLQYVKDGMTVTVKADGVVEVAE